MSRGETHSPTEGVVRLCGSEIPNGSMLSHWIEACQAKGSAIHGLFAVCEATALFEGASSDSMRIQAINLDISLARV